MPFTATGVEFVREAERLGVDSVWVPEFWAGDALTPLAYLAACTTRVRLATGIVQLGARTPAILSVRATSFRAAGRLFRLVPCRASSSRDTAVARSREAY